MLGALYAPVLSSAGRAERRRHFAFATALLLPLVYYLEENSCAAYMPLSYYACIEQTAGDVRVAVLYTVGHRRRLIATTL